MARGTVKQHVGRHKWQHVFGNFVTKGGKSSQTVGIIPSLNRPQRLSFLCSPKNFGGAYSRRLVRQSVSPSVRPIRVRPITSLNWSWISKPFYRNDHKAETTCSAHYLSPYLEGHNMTLQQNCVRPITLLFEVRFRKYFTEMIAILKWRVARII